MNLYKAAYKIIIVRYGRIDHMTTGICTGGEDYVKAVSGDKHFKIRSWSFDALHNRLKKIKGIK